MTLPDIFTKLLREYFRWTAIGVVLIVFGAGYGLALGKKVSVIQTISFSDRTRAKNDLAAASAFLQNLKSSLDRFRQEFTAADRDRLDKILPTKSEFPSLLLTIQNMADVAGLDLQNINVTNITNTATEAEQLVPEGESAPTEEAIGTIVNVPGLAAQDISISVGEGTSYDQFKRFLGIVESSGRLFDIVSLSYAQPTGGGAGSTAVYAFTLRTYYLTAPIEPPTS